MQGHNRRPSIPYRALAEGRQRVMKRSRIRKAHDDGAPWRMETRNGLAAVIDHRGHELGMVGIETAQRVVDKVNAARQRP